MEGLLCWFNGEGGYIFFVVFVLFVEYLGFIVDIGEWVLEELCCCFQELKEKGYGYLRVVVNIFILQFCDRLFVEKVKQVLFNVNCDLSLLELEIIESVVMDEL